MLLLEKHLTGSTVPGSQLTANLVALPSSSAIGVSWPRGTKGYTPIRGRVRQPCSLHGHPKNARRSPNGSKSGEEINNLLETVQQGQHLREEWDLGCPMGMSAFKHR